MEKIKIQSVGSLRVKPNAELLAVKEQSPNENSDDEFNKFETDTDDYDEDYDDDEDEIKFNSSKTDVRHDKAELDSEKIEVIPELIPYAYDCDTNDGAEGYDERSVEDDIAALYNGKVGDDEEFDEYGKLTSIYLIKLKIYLVSFLCISVCRLSSWMELF